jgi:uncharacterized membrane protein HdeD (DUF308 family)
MNPDPTLRRVTAAASGVLFLLIGALFFTGFGGLGQYGPAVRWSLGFVIVGYGVIRIVGAFKRRAHENQN